jgi:hypothetical protein
MFSFLDESRFYSQELAMALAAAATVILIVKDQLARWRVRDSGTTSGREHSELRSVLKKATKGTES